MVDGILTKLRNPVNQDLWLTDRFSTSVNHPLFLSLHMFQVQNRLLGSFGEICDRCYSFLDQSARSVSVAIVSPSDDSCLCFVEDNVLGG